jgi:hypothetical protein
MGLEGDLAHSPDGLDSSSISGRICDFRSRRAQGFGPLVHYLRQGAASEMVGDIREEWIVW